jgi:hypothetical protein
VRLSARLYGRLPSFHSLTHRTTDHHQRRHKPIRNAFIVGCALGLFQQLAAINTLMYYGAVVMEMAGFPSSASIELTAVLAMSQGVGVCTSLYLYSILPRRTVLLWSISGVIIGLVLIGVAFENIDEMQVSQSFHLSSSRACMTSHGSSHPYTPHHPHYKGATKPTHNLLATHARATLNAT